MSDIKSHDNWASQSIVDIELNFFAPIMKRLALVQSIGGGKLMITGKTNARLRQAWLEELEVELALGKKVGTYLDVDNAEVEFIV